MMKQQAQLGWLFAGDILAILVVTLVGFLDHYGVSLFQNWRWLTTFLPLVAAWFAIAPWLGVYRREIACQPRQVWRPILAAILSAPLAATFRGFWLNAAILPIFVGVLALTSAFGFFLWRLAWAVLTTRKARFVG